LWRYYKQKKDIQLIKSLATIEKLIYKFIDQGKKRMEENPALKDKPTNFLESILIENDNDRLTDAEIYGNVFTMLLAGEDTTSNSIAWATYYLAQHPNIVKKIREEANLIYANSNVVPSTELLSKLTYTDAVVQESMRIKPASPQLYMQAIEEQTIEGLLIPKGMKVILQNKSAQNNNKHFSNANEFKPERWLASGCPVNHQPEVIKTFGGGPRFCPGKSLAINELVLTISMLCKHFDFEMMVNPEEVEEGFAFTMHPKNLKLKLKHAN
jgi:cytochrome P450